MLEIVAQAPLRRASPARLDAGSAPSPEAHPQEDGSPGPPRERRTLRDITAARGDRQAARAQRRAEVERELREQLGLEAEGPGLPEAEGRGSRPGTPSARPRTGDAGPPRPPKPKPHRPLRCTPPSPAEARGPEARRWRSALTPVWPDRQRSGSPQSAAGESPSHASRPSTPRAASPSLRGDGGAAPAASPSFRSEDGAGPAAAPAIIALPDIRGRDAEADAAFASRAPEKSGFSSVATSPGGPPSVVSTSASDSPVGRAAPRSPAAPPLPPPAPVVVEDPVLAERTRQLEEGARRLREHAERVRAANRRARLFGHSPTSAPSDDELPGRGSSDDPPGAAASPSSRPRSRTRPHSAHEDRRLQEMRRKIADLDAINELERRRLEEEQREAEARQRAQEDFERRVQEATERELRELRERGERETRERAARDAAARRDLEDRTRRRQEQQREEEERSRNLEERRREGRTEQAQMKWQLFEEELERQWAAQETDERKRFEQYARERRRQYEEFDRQLVCERQRLATEAEFRAAARHQQARHAARADEAFYRPRRAPPPPASAPPQGEPRPPPFSSKRPPPPPAGVAKPPAAVLSPDECAVLKELQSVRAAPREAQKAKVKELLFRWHPDKNPACPEKATRLFQFVQRHRELVLGL